MPYRLKSNDTSFIIRHKALAKERIESRRSIRIKKMPLKVRNEERTNDTALKKLSTEVNKA